ncbi:post-transcriptional regulator [Listeria welshimeri]|uniref:post-transcriptional regulator n=1 Tax=Listeria welshimeri TaxID=1643 RepID=UPI001886E374|nr:post-transcriptional regulator [Listeria welshimeri]MBF2595770.1 post-transcriptional regulator [Listeria welshimeri]
MTDRFSAWYEDLELAILIKVEDFHILGYREIKASHIWAFLTEEKWKNNPAPALHERINDVMQMKIGQLMQFIMTTAEQESNNHVSQAENTLLPNMED